MSVKISKFYRFIEKLVNLQILLKFTVKSVILQICSIFLKFTAVNSDNDLLVTESRKLYIFYFLGLTWLVVNVKIRLGSELLLFNGKHSSLL